MHDPHSFSVSDLCPIEGAWPFGMWGWRVVGPIKSWSPIFTLQKTFPQLNRLYMTLFSY